MDNRVDGVKYEGLDAAEAAIFKIRPFKSEYVSILLKKSIAKFLRINDVGFYSLESKERLIKKCESFVNSRTATENAATSVPVPGPSTQPGAPTKRKRQGAEGNDSVTKKKRKMPECKICKLAECSYVFLNCGHVGCCKSCYNVFLQQMPYAKCPYCRAYVFNMLELKC